jgi:hypothetical protein
MRKVAEGKAGAYIEVIISKLQTQFRYLSWIERRLYIHTKSNSDRINDGREVAMPLFTRCIPVYERLSHIPTPVPPTTRMELELLGSVIQGKADSCLISLTL